MSEKLALVTGGSRGIGKACALELAKAGYDVVINYAGNDDAANKTVEEIKALGVDSAAYKFDVSNKEQVDAGIAEIVEKFGLPSSEDIIKAMGIAPDVLDKEVACTQNYHKQGNNPPSYLNVRSINELSEDEYDDFVQLLYNK